MFFHNIAYNFDLVEKGSDSVTEYKEGEDEGGSSILYDPVLKFAPMVIPRLKFEITQPAPVELDDATDEPVFEEFDE